MTAYRNDQEAVQKLVRSAVKAFAEMNEIRARDGVPYTHNGCKSSVSEEYFSSVVDELSDAVLFATGRPAHCHPELYCDKPAEVPEQVGAYVVQDGEVTG